MMQIFGADQAVKFEIDTNLITSIPGFAAKVGEVAAAWARTEVNIGIYFGIMLGVEPAAAVKKMERRSAYSITRELEGLIAALPPAHQPHISSIIAELDRVRGERNCLQHDLWARRPGEDGVLYAVNAKTILRALLDISEPVTHGVMEASAAGHSSYVAEKVADDATNAFTVKRLQSLREHIDAVGDDLYRAFCHALAEKAVEKLGVSKPMPSL